MEFGGWGYLGVFLASAALCWGITPLALKFALQRRILDYPRDYKNQVSPIPYMGGSAIVIAFATALLLGALIIRPGAGLEEMPWIILTGIGLSVLGLVDDIRGLNPAVRLAIEFAAAVLLWNVGVQIILFEPPLLNASMTILWLVGITNAFNLLDNMDGLSAGVAGIASFSFFAIAALNGQFLVAALSIALAGCALGFLRHNFHPARIYMGDGGSLFLGFLLASIAIKLRFEGPIEVTFMVPILVLAVPLLDTILVVATRIMHRRNPFSGGRDHVSHRLVFVGIPIRAAVGLIYVATVATGWLALIMSRVDVVTGYLLMGYVVTIAAFLGMMLAMVPVYETSKRRRMMIREVEPHEDPADLRTPGTPAPLETTTAP